jgi:hypothetical protein
VFSDPFSIAFGLFVIVFLLTANLYLMKIFLILGRIEELLVNQTAASGRK